MYTTQGKNYGRDFLHHLSSGTMKNASKMCVVVDTDVDYNLQGLLEIHFFIVSEQSVLLINKLALFLLDDEEPISGTPRRVCTELVARTF